MPFIRTNRTGTGFNLSQTGVQGPTGGGGGGTPILLPGLNGWALTAGPQQTLSSAGVIASGPLDLTAVGSPTYGANGVVLNGTDQALNGDGLSALYGPTSFAGQNIFITAEVNLTEFYPPGVDASGVMVRQDGGSDYGLYVDTPSNKMGFRLGDAQANGAAEFSLGSIQIVFGWCDLALSKVYLKIGSADTVEASLTAVGYGAFTTTGIGSFDGNTYGFWKGTIRRLRFVKGDITAWVAAIPWILAGPGRTDEEVAAYTG